jgi:hypothetical protein
MKKLSLLIAGLMIAGVTYAAPCDKHKDKAACAKTSKSACKEKSCCKKKAEKTAKADSDKDASAKAETARK